MVLAMYGKSNITKYISIKYIAFKLLYTNISGASNKGKYASICIFGSYFHPKWIKPGQSVKNDQILRLRPNKSMGGKKKFPKKIYFFKIQKTFFYRISSWNSM